MTDERETMPRRVRKGKHALGVGWVRLGKVSNKWPFG